MKRLPFFQLLTLSLWGLSLQASAAYYDTLPAGVRLLAMRQVTTSNISSSYAKSNNESPYAIEQNITFSSLKNLNSFTQTTYEQLHAISPAAAEQLELGEYKADAKAKVNVNGFGLAYGITNYITAYGSIPYYDASTDISFTRTRGNNYNQVKKLVSSGQQTDFQNIYNNMLGQLPDANGPLLQSLLVNRYGYQPLGLWQGKGYGDAEFGMMMRLTDFKDRGLALSFGGVAPTGKLENPDILQDISFGDGQWDVFAEFGGGFEMNRRWLVLNSWARYTYQMPYSRVLRAPDDKEFTLTDKKQDFKIKLGDKFDYVLSPTWIMTDWLTFKTEYIFNYQMKSVYSSSNVLANEILATNTESMAQHARIATNVSSTKLYLMKKFMLPASIEFSAQTMFMGQNTPKYSRYDIELRFYF
ncbi:MAG: hypothetical protein ACOYL6_07530 [Bacteriovoracaceae bacterium]